MRSSRRLSDVSAERETDQRRVLDLQVVEDLDDPVNSAINGELLVRKLTMCRQVDGDAVVALCQDVDSSSPVSHGS
jgi:hypothetical protein